MKPSTIVEAAALAIAVLALEAGVLFHGVAMPLGTAIASLEVEAVLQRVRAEARAPSFEESIEVQGTRAGRGM